MNRRTITATTAGLVAFALCAGAYQFGVRASDSEAPQVTPATTSTTIGELQQPVRDATVVFEDGRFRTDKGWFDLAGVSVATPGPLSACGANEAAATINTLLRNRTWQLRPDGGGDIAATTGDGENLAELIVAAGAAKTNGGADVALTEKLYDAQDVALGLWADCSPMDEPANETSGAAVKLGS